MIPSGDEFEKRMQQFIKEDDVVLLEYIRKIAHCDSSSVDETISSAGPTEMSSQPVQDLLDVIGLSSPELSGEGKILVQNNLRTVAWVATQYLDRGLTLQVLIDIGNKGLIAAAKDFSCNRSTPFAKYSLWFIRRFISKQLIDKKKHDRSLRKLQLPDEDDNEEIGEEDATSPKDDVVPASTETQSMLRADLRRLMTGLSPRERDVLSLRFGFDDGRQRTLQEVAEVYGITRERVRQIEVRALRKIRLNGQPRGQPPATEAKIERVPTKNFRDALRKLPEAEAEILRLKWGFTDGRIYSSIEMAKKLGIDASEVDALEAKALKID
jgi:RNA polymerase sigma factor (sigma-70 family)